MARRDVQSPTNEHIVRLLESVRSELAEMKRRQEEIERCVRLLVKKTP